jgi:(2R)-3-sulfolactate dehydrogenase (NADP+)
VIDPGALAGQAAYLGRIEALITTMLEDEGVRIPGQRHADTSGTIAVADALAQTLRHLARP